jgi:hypothetical protein
MSYALLARRMQIRYLAGTSGSRVSLGLLFSFLSFIDQSFLIETEAQSTDRVADLEFVLAFYSSFLSFGT